MGAVREALTALSAALSSFDPDSLVGVPVDDLASLLALGEQVRRQLPVLEHAVVGRLAQRDAARELSEYGARSTAGLLERMLRISAADARHRVEDATTLGTETVRAQAAGAIGAAHVREIQYTLDELPNVASDDLEAELVEAAAEMGPAAFRAHCLLLRDELDPTHQRRTAEAHQRRRNFTMQERADGSVRVSGDLTPEAGIKWTTLIHAFSAPAPAADGTPDPRSPGQRRHDALITIADLLLNSKELPAAGGVPVTLLITATPEQLQSRAGRVRTEHGALIDTELALKLTDAGGTIYALALDDVTGKLNLGRTQRLASPTQRRALAARDGGCSFPNCTAPPSWCQTHHVLSWLFGGHTNLDNLTLLCGPHHRTFEQDRWHCTMRNGQPTWTRQRQLSAAA